LEFQPGFVIHIPPLLIMDFNTTIPLRYYINLGRRQDRRIETEIALAQAGISAERFPAVDARFVRKNRGYASAGRYALALSQRLALRSASLKKADAVLILEDDVVFHPQLLERLAEIELPDDWGIFYFGCAHRKRPWPAGPRLVRTPYALDTHAFAVRAPYYRKVIAALARREKEFCEHARASDWYLADLHQEIPTYACFPNLAWQSVAASDLAGGTYSNYTRSGEQISSAGEIIALQSEMWGAKPWRSWDRCELAADEDYSEETRYDRNAHAIRLTTKPPVKEPRVQEPCLGLLFLTRGDVCQPEIWREFAAEAGTGVKILSHAKDQEAAARGFLAGSAIENWQETEWGDISLVRAMLSLLTAGLADESLTHFAFVSESCIPIRPWAEMRRRLIIDPRSMLYYETSGDMKKKHLERISIVEDLPDRARRIHSQWCLLDREAATCVTEVDFTPHFEKLSAADEHYIGSILALRGYNENDRINRQEITWAKWQDDGETTRPRAFDRTNAGLTAELAAFPGFFARKFPIGSDIGKWGLHRP
jgi:hypothetical protein